MHKYLIVIGICIPLGIIAFILKERYHIKDRYLVPVTVIIGAATGVAVSLIMD